jgi:cyclase
MLEGQGGNITVAVGDDGIIIVDSEFAPLHDKIKAAIEKLSPLPIKYLINAHFQCAVPQGRRDGNIREMG